jgi:hypothetical protein
MENRNGRFTYYHIISRESVGRHRLTDEDFTTQVGFQRVLNPDLTDEECEEEAVRVFRQQVINDCILQIGQWVDGFEQANLRGIALQGYNNLRTRTTQLAQAIDLFMTIQDDPDNNEGPIQEGREILRGPLRNMLCDIEWYFSNHRELSNAHAVTSLIRKVQFNAEYIYFHFDRLENNEDNNQGI